MKHAINQLKASLNSLEGLIISHQNYVNELQDQINLTYKPAKDDLDILKNILIANKHINTLYNDFLDNLVEQIEEANDDMEDNQKFIESHINKINQCLKEREEIINELKKLEAMK